MSALAELLAASRAALDDAIREAHPEECCALVFEVNGRLALVRVPNVADALHAADPETFPRTAKTGYAIDGRIILKAEREGQTLRAVVHSHPDGGVALSEEDLRLARFDGRPTWPGVDYVVLDGYGGRLRTWAIHAWDEGSGRFVEVAHGPDIAR